MPVPPTGVVAITAISGNSNGTVLLSAPYTADMHENSVIAIKHVDRPSQCAPKTKTLASPIIF
jgi:hypothetical protein